MELVKKNIVSIIFGVVALIAVFVAVIYPMPGSFDQLNDQLNKRTKEIAAINGILNTPRQLPPVFLGSGARQLEVFPNKLVIAWANDQIARVKNQGEDMRLLVLDIDDRIAWHLDDSKKTKGPKQGLLVPNILPDPGDAKGTFRDKYDEVMRAYPNPANYKPGEKVPEPGKLLIDLKAGIPPAMTQIDEEMKAIQARYTAGIKIVAGTRVGEEEAMKEMAKEQASVADRMKLDRAAQILMYVNPDGGFKYHARMAELYKAGQMPNEVDIWWAQMGLWIQSDIAKAIMAVNRGAKSVQDSVVKHLLEIGISDQYLTENGPITVTPGAAPLIPTRGPSGTEARGNRFGVNATGRVCNELYDVVRFNFRINVDARRLEQFLVELSRDRFLNVVEMNVTSVDRGRAQAEGYMYGESPVVQVTITCEALFLRGWTMRLMPLDVKRALKIEGN